jgi:hypothetical protein
MSLNGSANQASRLTRSKEARKQASKQARKQGRKQGSKEASKQTNKQTRNNKQQQALASVTSALVQTHSWLVVRTFACLKYDINLALGSRSIITKTNWLATGP